MNILIHQSSLLSERNCPWSQREGEAHSEIIRADAVSGNPVLSGVIPQELLAPNPPYTRFQ